jgi:hypothetical protein
MQIGCAALFGWLFAGVLLLQANFRVMERPMAANRALALGLLTSIAILASVFVVPKGGPTFINLAAAVGLYMLTASLQGDAFVEHRSVGGARRSHWLVLGAVIATWVGLCGAILGILTAIGVDN